MLSLKRLWRGLFFSEFTPLLRMGEKQSLQAQDLPALPSLLHPQTQVVDESQIDWSSGPKLLRTLWWSGRYYSWQPLGLYVLNVTFALTGPVVVNLFVKQLQAGLNSPADFYYALALGLAIGGCGILSGLSLQHYFYHNLRRNQILTNIVNTKIFRQALALGKAARERTPIGDIVNHMSSDTDSIVEGSNAVGDLFYCVLMISGALALLYHYIGSTALVALLLMSVLAPLTRKVGREFTRFDEELMNYRDRRVSLMSQLLSAIRLVKSFAWESSVSQEVQLWRGQELAARRKVARAELIVTMLYVSVGTLVLFVVLAVHAWRGGAFDPALIFTCVSLFALLEDPFAFMSRVISMVVSARVASNRVAKFLSEPAVPLREQGQGGHAVGLKTEDLCVRYEGAALDSLHELNLHLQAGQSLAVVGAVGSGKSTFLHALLGELTPRQGRILFTGHERDGEVRLGYVPQEAFILNGTLRENLTFGESDLSEADLRLALELSGLQLDVQRMQAGLDTEIGEKGVNLSGGQRQRVSLARAILHRPQLVLLDDPLSAVDSSTETHLVKHLLFAHWQNVTRVVITHRLTYLSQFDRIAFLAEGRLVDFGTFAELEKRCPPFGEYLRDFKDSHLGVEGVGVEAENPVAAAVQEAATNARITQDEDREFGAVRGGVYWDYIRSLGGENERRRPWILALLFLAAASGTAFPLLQKGWLAAIANAQIGQSSWLVGARLQRLAQNPLTAIYIYGGLGLVVLLAAVWADLFWLQRGLKAGRNIHDQMLKSILGATIRFFDSTPVGRILQRFSRDMESVDIQLQWSFEHSMKCLAQVVFTLSLILVSLPWVGVFIAPVLYLYYRLQRSYRASAREVKRLDSIARSPRYAHFKETLQGLPVIRAYGRSPWFLQEFYARLTHSQRMFYGHYMVNRWFSSRIPVTGGVVSIITAAAIVFAVRSQSLSAGMAGLLTVYSLSFWGVLNWGIRIWSEVEARMTSMERIKFYSRLPQEESSQTSTPTELPLPWPTAGHVQFKDVHVRYAAHLPLVLKGLSFEARPGSRVGIIGRTGSGKSTLFQALYRFVEVECGQIEIDGVNIGEVPLQHLRRALAIIPQDPTLFMGTLRSNLDRYEEFSDEEIWRVLQRTSLQEFVRRLPQGLLTPLVENGANLSQGQRQLLCLARALLVQARVIVLDEATASVDVQTDALVQRVVRESCQGVTMLIIAHRLGTVRDCDQILEVAHGEIRRRIEPKRQKLATIEELC